jgi:hypothetical protein
MSATLALALAPLLLLGITEPMAGGRTVLRSPGAVQQRVVVVRPACINAGFGWGLYDSFGPTPYYGYARVPPRNAAPVEMHVRPRKAAVIVDGTNLGQARDFNSRAYPLWLRAGTHELELSRPGYLTLRVKFAVKRGKAYRVHYELREGEGVDPRSSKAPQEPPAESGSE